MVKVKVIKKDDSSTTYNVEYPRAYVNAIIMEDNSKGKKAVVKAIFIGEWLAAVRLEEELVLVPDRVECGIKSTNKVKSNKSYWVTDTTAGDLTFAYTNLD